MTRYTSVTDDERRAMLDAIGVTSIDELFSVIPERYRLPDGYDLPAGMAEQDVYEHLRELADRNVSTEDEISFLGAGMYDHYVPAIVDMLQQRSEFLTPYTPYQPEVSQGTLQVMFEYQTAMTELTGLPVSNATVYDGPSAVAAAAYMLTLSGKPRRLLASRGLHPHTRETLRTTSAGFGTVVEEIPLRDGVTDLEALAAAMADDVAGIFVGQPNFLGAVEDLESIAVLKEQAALVVAADPITLGLLRAPGEQGADICVGEGQPLGNHPAFGGPTFGFITARQEYLRRMPGRISGETTDVDGRRAFVLTLQTREQHIRREKATSNITTAQTLNALAAVVYLCWLGRRGIVEIGELMLQRTHYLRGRLAAIDGVELLHDQPIVREFPVRLPVPVQQVIEHCQGNGVNPGYALGRDYPEHGDALLIAVTERRTRVHLDLLVDLVAEAVNGSPLRADARRPAA